MGRSNENFEAAPYPAPNVEQKSRHSGRTVLPSIVKTWGGKKAAAASYYGAGIEIPDGQHPPAGYAYNDAQN